MHNEKEKNPLAEVFGYLPDDRRAEAVRYRNNRLCPFNNTVPSCTKDKAKDPLGVCSILNENGPVITCPIRFRENWLIAGHAADFFFGKNANWTSLAEVRLTDYYGKSAGNIDIVLVSYDNDGKIIDFGALEIQAVYISGNVRDPFSYYMKNVQHRNKLDWSEKPNYPRPDYLSSSRKRLAPQLLFKGGILNEWKKKVAVALDSEFFKTLPELTEVKKHEADLAWLIYELAKNETEERYELRKVKTVYTKFDNALSSITKPRPGKVDKFIEVLQSKVDEKLDNPPDNSLIENPLEH